MEKNIFYSILGNVVYPLCQWGIIIVLAKLGSAGDVGSFVFPLVVTSPLFMFSNLQLRNIQATDVKDNYKFCDYLGVRVITSILAAFSCLIISICLKDEHYLWIYIAIFALAKLPESISDIIHGLFQRLERFDLMAKSFIIKGLGSVLFVGIVFSVTNSVSCSILSLAIWWTTVLIFYDFRIASQFTVIRPNLETRVTRNIIQSSVPLGIVSGIISFNIYVPKYFIKYYMGIEPLGYFASILYVLNGIGQLANAVGMGTSPRLAMYYIENQKRYWILLCGLLLVVLLIGASATLVSVLIGRNILEFVYGTAYGHYKEVFVWLMFSGIFMFMNSILYYGMIASRKVKIQVPLVTFIGIVGCFLNYRLVPRYGLLGAAWAILLVRIIEFTLCVPIILKYPSQREFFKFDRIFRETMYKNGRNIE